MGAHGSNYCGILFLQSGLSLSGQLSLHIVWSRKVTQSVGGGAFPGWGSVQCIYVHTCYGSEKSCCCSFRKEACTKQRVGNVYISHHSM